jgi:hypothetical protein
MTKPVPVAAYKRMQKDVDHCEAKVAEARRRGLELIASRNRHVLDREDACGEYMDARFWLMTFRERLAKVHPQKNCHLSPAAKARHEARHGAS